MRKTLLSRSKTVFWANRKQNVEVTVLTENCVQYFLGGLTLDIIILESSHYSTWLFFLCFNYVH